MNNDRKGLIFVLEIKDFEFDLWKGSITCSDYKTTQKFASVLELLNIIDKTLHKDGEVKEKARISISD